MPSVTVGFLCSKDMFRLPQAIMAHGQLAVHKGFSVLSALVLVIFLPRCSVSYFYLLNMTVFFSAKFSSLLKTLWMATHFFGLPVASPSSASPQTCWQCQCHDLSRSLLKMLSSTEPRYFRQRLSHLLHASKKFLCFWQLSRPKHSASFYFTSASTYSIYTCWPVYDDVIGHGAKGSASIKLNNAALPSSTKLATVV